MEVLILGDIGLKTPLTDEVYMYIHTWVHDIVWSVVVVHPVSSGCATTGGHPVSLVHWQGWPLLVPVPLTSRPRPGHWD